MIIYCGGYWCTVCKSHYCAARPGRGPHEELSLNYRAVDRAVEQDMRMTLTARQQAHQVGAGGKASGSKFKKHSPMGGQVNCVTPPKLIV